MCNDCGRPADFLGEIQFCFVCFLIGHCLEALDHWKQLVRLMCCCQSAVCHRTQLYYYFLDMIDAHLTEIPEDFLVDIVASVNIIYMSLRQTAMLAKNQLLQFKFNYLYSNLSGVQFCFQLQFQATNPHTVDAQGWRK